MESPAPIPQSFPTRLIVVFLLFTGTLAGVGYSLIRQNAQRLEQKGFANLQAVAELKVKLVDMWRKGLLEDGKFFFSSPVLADEFHRVINSAPNPPPARIQEWFESVRTHHQYTSVFLLDREGEVHIAVPGDGHEIRRHMFLLAQESMQKKQVILTDLHQSRGEKAVNMHLVAPVVDMGVTREEAIGALVATIDPEVFLFPLLRDWPNSSRSAETLIVREDGGTVEFLSPLRHSEGLAQPLTLPVKSSDLPAAQALRGVKGVVQGHDYRGVPVLAYVERIPDTGWFLVAKMDRTEFFGDIRRQTSILASVVALLIGVVGVAILALWRHERVQVYKQAYRAETERLALAERFANLTRQANDIIVLLDEDLRIQEVNDRALETYGYSREELMGMSILQLHPSSHQVLREEVESKRNERGGVVFESVQNRKDGTPFPVEISDQIVRIDGKEFHQGIIRDITERKRMEDSLRRVNRALRVLSACNQAMIMATEETRLVREVCETIQREGGFPRVCVELTRDGHSLPPQPVVCVGSAAIPYDGGEECCEGGQSVSALIEKAMSGKMAVVVEDLMSEEWAGACGSPFEEKDLKSVAAFPMLHDGRLVGGLAIYSSEASAFDSEEIRLLAELASDLAYGIEALRTREQHAHALESLRRLATAIDQLDEVVVITDTEGVIQFVNPAFERATGYTALEALGNKPSLIKSGRHDDAFYEQLWNTIMGGQTWTGKMVNRRKDGSLYTEEAVISPVFGKDGKITNFVAVKRDITERIEMEERIRQMQRMEAVGQLAGGIAHDFNNLLQVVLAYADFTRQTFERGSRQYDDLGLVLNAGRRGADLTRQLLAFSRQTELFISSFDIRPLVKEACKMLQRTIPASIDISYEFAPELPEVMADPSQVHQILINLCVNAKDAMPHGGRLSVSAYPTTLTEKDSAGDPEVVTGKFVVLAVKDTGTGIPPEIVPRIFDPFFTTKAPGKGTGLGLASVYGIVRQHGGFITCESTVGQGSVFRVHLPAGELSAANGASSESEEELPRGTERLLLAEDEEAIREVTSRALSDLGYHVLPARNGKEALELLTRFPAEIDLAILDHQMPEMDGELCLQEARKLGFDLPVIVASGFLDPDLRERLAPLMVTQTFLKPYTLPALARAVRAALDSRSATPAG